MINVVKDLPHIILWYSYRGTITRRVANQGKRGTFSPWGKADLTRHQPGILMSWGKNGENDTKHDHSYQKYQYTKKITNMKYYQCKKLPIYQKLSKLAFNSFLYAPWFWSFPKLEFSIMELIL